LATSPGKSKKPTPSSVCSVPVVKSISRNGPRTTDNGQQRYPLPNPFRISDFEFLICNAVVVPQCLVFESGAAVEIKHPPAGSAPLSEGGLG
jgi:hypothetical protein